MPYAPEGATGDRGDVEEVLLSRAQKVSSDCVTEGTNIKRKAFLRVFCRSLGQEIRSLLWNPNTSFSFIPRATVPLKHDRSDLSTGYKTLMLNFSILLHWFKFSMVG
jgi:hypothetical protein